MYSGGLGGKDSSSADREAGLKLVEIFPGIVDVLKANKAFLARATAWVAGQGIRQFVDLGAGTPASPNTHETAQAAEPGARVVYIDNDPVAIARLRGEIGSGQNGVRVLPADVRDTEQILGALTGDIDLGQPACLIMGALLHFFEEPAARDLVAAYTAVAEPGSYLIISTLSGAGKVADEFTAAYSEMVAPIYCHSAEALKTFLGPAELVPPGIVGTAEWRPGEGDAATPSTAPLHALGVVARL